MLSLIYKRLDEVNRYRNNPKLHNLGKLVRLITKYGFRNPLIYDEAVDAISSGNGRHEAIYLMYTDYPSENVPVVPKNIKVDETDGMWLVPVIYGIESESIEMFEAFLVDDNNSVMSGSGMTALDMSRVWAETEYLEILARTLPHLQTVDEDDYFLMHNLANALETPDYNEEPDFTIGTEPNVSEQKHKISLTFSTLENKALFAEFLQSADDLLTGDFLVEYLNL